MIYMESRLRQIIIKLDSEEQRDLWYSAFKFAKKRALHEKEVLEAYIHQIHKDIMARKQERRREKLSATMALRDAKGDPRARSNHDLTKAMSSTTLNKQFSEATLQRGYLESELRPDESDSDFSRTNSVENLSEDRRSLELAKLKERATQLLSMSKDLYEGGPGEFQIQVIGNDGQKDIVGMIDVETSLTLSKLRENISTELDNVPDNWIFLKQGVPVGVRQEEQRKIEYVADGDIISIKKALVKKDKKPVNGIPPSAIPTTRIKDRDAADKAARRRQRSKSRGKKKSSS